MTFNLRVASSVMGAAALFTAGPAPLPAQAPAEVTSFDEVTARLDRGGSLYLYLSTAQWLDGLSKNLGDYRKLLLDQIDRPGERENAGRYFDLGIHLLQKSGLEQISGVGLSSVAIKPATYRNTFFLHHYRGKDLGYLGASSGAAPHPLAALELLPANTAWAGFSDFDLPALFTSVRVELERSGIPEVKKSIDGGVAQFTALAGLPLETVLRSLGGGGGIVLTLDPAKLIEIDRGGQKRIMIPHPRLAVLIEVKDDKIFQRLDQVFGGLPGIVKVDEPAQRLRTMVFPALPDFTVRATVAQLEKYLVISTDDSLVRDLVATRASGRGFKSTPAFAEMSAGLPVDGNGFSLVTQSFVDAWTQVRAQMVKARSKGSPAEDAFVQKVMDGQDVYTQYGVSSHLDNGWLTVSKSGQGGSQLLAPLLVFPAMAVGAAIPIYTKLHPPSPPPEPPEAADSAE